MKTSFKDILKKCTDFLKHGRLNNGEPVSQAFKKTLIQLLVILMIPAVIIGLMYAFTIVTDSTTDDTYLTVSMSSKYREPVRCSIGKISDDPVSSGYAATELLSDWCGDKITQAEIEEAEEGAHKEDYINTTTYLFETYLKGCEVDTRKNLTNFELLSEMYDHIKEGGAVAVSLLVTDRLTEKSEPGIGIVTSINFTYDAITVFLENGIAEVYTCDDFIAASRYTDYETSLTEKIGFAIGLYAKNTAWFIEKN